MEKKIIKARIGKCIDYETNGILYNLQFKEEGKTRYDGFSLDTFVDYRDAEAALRQHNEGVRRYWAHASLGKKGRYFICKAAEWYGYW